MVEWYWLLITVWLATSLGVLIAAICFAAKGDNKF